MNLLIKQNQRNFIFLYRIIYKKYKEIVKMIKKNFLKKAIQSQIQKVFLSLHLNPPKKNA